MLGFLNLLRELLGWFVMVRSEQEAASDSQLSTRPPAHGPAQPSLRPPTIALDMLFLLAFIAFLEMNPVSESVISHSANLPTASKNAMDKPVSPLALRPIRIADGWLYKTTDGRSLSAKAVAASVRQKKMVPILIITKSSSVQEYLDAQQPLMAQGLTKVGLAVTSDGGSHK